ncbi:MAG: MoaD/ThiS family protein [Caldisphaeraceae archaeon]|nr:MoaD/ThiS family protein [Caldisphaeraceae archaeon]
MIEMKVEAYFILQYYKFIGKNRVEVELPEGSSVEDLIDFIERNVKNGFKEKVLNDGEVSYPNMILVNGKRIEFLDGLKTKLREGDKITFSPLALFAL